MKNELIDSYRFQLETNGDQHLDIPEGFVEQFWDWFKEKSIIKDSKRTRKEMRITSVPIVSDNFCFKNTYRISKAFVKRLYYFEGFAYKISTEKALKHAFNICKHGKVNDYSLHHKPDEKQDYYIGVRIPLSFARMIYREKGDYEHAQDALLVAYFMYKHNIEGYLNFTSP